MVRGRVIMSIDSSCFDEHIDKRLKIITKFNRDIIIQEVMDDYVRDTVRNRVEYTMNLRDEGVRKALIKLGWTPPPDDNHI